MSGTVNMASYLIPKHYLQFQLKLILFVNTCVKFGIMLIKWMTIT